MYADKITESMRKTIDETNRRRSLQKVFNEENGIEPTQLKKTKEQIMGQTSVLNIRADKDYYVEDTEISSSVLDPVTQNMNQDQLSRLLEETKRQMKAAAKDMNFLEAARLRDEMFNIEKQLKSL